MYEEILIATDGGEIASNAASVGVALARTFEARIHVLSVAENDDESTRDERRTAVEAIASKAQEAGCEVETAVSAGRPANEILSYADDRDVDAIVVGTHGRTGFKQTLLGSVALEVVRDSNCPVLTVGKDTVEGDFDGRIDDVCLATDGTTGSSAATEHALALADASNATLDVLYVVDTDPDVTEVRERFRKHGETVTTEVEDRATERGLETTRTVTEGDAHEEILEYAAAEAVDTLVMGAESKSNLERLVLGSVSQRVVPNATVPVLTVRTTER